MAEIAVLVCLLGAALSPPSACIRKVCEPAIALCKFLVAWIDARFSKEEEFL